MTECICGIFDSDGVYGYTPKLPTKCTVGDIKQATKHKTGVWLHPVGRFSQTYGVDVRRNGKTTRYTDDSTEVELDDKTSVRFVLLSPFRA